MNCAPVCGPFRRYEADTGGCARRSASPIAGVFFCPDKPLRQWKLSCSHLFVIMAACCPSGFLIVAKWQLYEDEIEKQFREDYPTARITRNAKLIGKFSKVAREIDILIQEQTSDLDFRIVVDAKHRGRRIDVGDVEAFLGLMRDVEAHTGMMIALAGYTKAAINRAHYDDLDVILDVLNLDELKAFQGPTAIPYSGEHGVCIVAPFGWIVDATKRPHMLATLYQRGLTFKQAMKNDEWMYINFWKKVGEDRVGSLDALVKYQEGYILGGSPDAEIRLLEGVPNQKVGAKTLVRRLKKKTWKGPEFTGFVEFEKFIFMCVLFSPEELERKNLRKRASCCGKLSHLLSRETIRKRLGVLRRSLRTCRPTVKKLRCYTGLEGGIGTWVGWKTLGKLMRGVWFSCLASTKR